MNKKMNKKIGDRVAILVDGSFFIKRFRSLNKGKINWNDVKSAKLLADELYKMCLKHLNEYDYLHRILYYDCEPISKRLHHPISGKCIDFSKTIVYQFRQKFFEELKKKRKVAIRLGYVKYLNNWTIKKDKLKDLFSRKITINDLKESDVDFQMTQKGVDIKIGIDIASLAYKKLVTKIILISGDGDFVPAAKLARKEGIDFVLDPMWNHIDDSLFEHIDGLKSTIPKPIK
jgi:uncharacterized LabA/DUF88 family protein